MAELLIVIPVLRRPHRAQPVYESATAATDVPHRVLFVTSPGDRRERHACLETGADVAEVPWGAARADWAKKINEAYRESDEPWIFLGADDLVFHSGWASAALSAAGYVPPAYGPSDPELAHIGIVGTNDLGNPRVKAGKHSTHPLVRRAYADEHGTIDGPGAILCEAYDHQFSDDELVETAKARGAWTFARGSWVEHIHPYFGKSTMDSTYRKALRATRADRTLFQQRRRLWAS